MKIPVNLKALLNTIRYAEGSALQNGYTIMFGGKHFTDFSKHPNQKTYFLDRRTGQQNYSTAAGAYQFLFSTWENLRKKLNLPDFSPDSQDKAAIELIRQSGAFDLIGQGKFNTAISKIRKIWASLPGAGYLQPEKNISELQNYYKSQGGKIA